MIVEVKIPSPGESITEVEIANWLKADGDFVQMDEILCEIETDKATLPLPAAIAGVLKIIIPSRESAKVGAVLCTLDTSAAAAAAGGSKPAELAPALPQAAAPIQPVPAAKAQEAPGTIPAAPQTLAAGYAAGLPSVAAQKLMTEQGVAAVAVIGTGKGGRVTKGDVLTQKAAPTPANAISVPPEPPVSPKIAEAKADPAPVLTLGNLGGSRAVSRQKMSRIRRKISERLVSVKNETAMLTTFNEVDMSAIFKLREEHKEAFLKKYETKLGFMGFFTKAVTAALKDFPAVNAMIDGDEIVYHEYVDVGIAVSGPKGLLVPVLRNAESLNIAQIETAISHLAKKARANQLSLEEMSGGTFSITNGGVFGSMLSTPIINPPQSAILGMHNVVERPIAVKGQVVIRPVMYVALSYDHRIIDGRESVSFLYQVKNYLEDPARLLLEI